MDHLEHLSLLLNFKYKYKRADDSGRMFKNGSWNGVVGMLSRKEADTGSRIAMTLERTYVNDFCVSLGGSRMAIVIKTPSGSNLNVWAYMKIFHMNAWYFFYVLSFILAIGMALTLSSWFVGNEKDSIGLLGGIGFVGMAWIHREYKVAKTRNSVRIAALSIALFGWTCFSCYEAILTSSMTILEKPPQIKTLSDVIKYGFTTVTVKGTVYENIARGAKHGTELYDVYNQIMKNNPNAFLNSRDAINQVSSNPLYAFYGPSFYFMRLKGFTAIPMANSYISYASFALQLDSEFTKVFNYYIIKMYQISDVRYSPETRKLTMLKEDKTLDKGKIVILDYLNVLFPSLLLSAGTGLAFLITLGEAVIRVVRKRNVTANDVQKTITYKTHTM